MSHEAARTMVTGILDDNAVIHGIRFQMRGVRYSPECLREVRQAVLAARLHVRHWPQGGDGYAEYVSSGTSEARDTIYTGFSTISRPTQKGLVVHEAIHAWCDLRNLHWMNVATSEAAAWLAQCVALQNLQVSPCPAGSSAESRHCWETAWSLATIVRTEQRELTHDEVERLRRAIAAYPVYQPAAAPAEYDGVPGQHG